MAVPPAARGRGRRSAPSRYLPDAFALPLTKRPRGEGRGANPKLFDISRVAGNDFVMNPTFMREAIQISIEKMRANQGGPFGAVIVRNGEVAGRGWNQVTSANDPTAHAEVTAIRDACRNLKTFQLSDCELYTSCEPCPMCLAATYWARLKKVYFGNSRTDAAQIGFDDDFIYSQIGLPLAERSLVLEQCCAGEAIAAFEEWKEKADKVRY